MVRSIFQEGITFGGRTSGSFNILIFKRWVAKKILASQLGFKFGVVRGFQKGITLRGRASGSFQNS